MEIIESLYTQVTEWLLQFATVQGALQIGTIIACLFLATLTHRRMQSFVTRLLGDLENRRATRFFLKGMERVTFPLSLLLYLVIFGFVLKQFGGNTTLFEIFTPLMLSLAAIRIVVFILRMGSPPSPALKAWENFISLSIWTIVALHLIGWLEDIAEALDSIGFETGDNYFSLLSIIKLLFTVILFMLVANWLSKTIERRTAQSELISQSMSVGLAKVSKFTLYALAVIIALSTVGIDLTTFAVFSGAIGVGIGFGLQKIFSNFISGFILLFDRSIRPGDVISIGERFGWVQALHARYIVVRDRDGVETLIPNENLITTEVINWSYTDRSIRLKVPIQISYDDDPELALELLLKSCEGQPRVLMDPPPAARLVGFGDSGIDFELRVWLSDPENGVANIRSDIYIAIWKLFKEHNITIPFPQRDVHIKSQPETTGE